MAMTRANELDADHGSEGRPRRRRPNEADIVTIRGTSRAETFPQTIAFSPSETDAIELK